MASNSKEYNNDYQAKCKVSFYTSPKLKRIIKQEAEKVGSVSVLVESIVKNHFKYYNHESIKSNGTNTSTSD